MFIPLRISDRRLLEAALLFVATSACTDSEQQFAPEHAAFRAANQQIETYSGLQSFGNSGRARELAARFSRFLVAIREEHFESEHPDPLPGAQPIITYCQLDTGRVCFLSNMAELARFPQESRDLLAELSWQAARTVIGLELPPEAEIAVGIRGGGLFFGVTAVGEAGGIPVTQAGSGVNSEVLYRFFAQGELDPPAVRGR